MTTTYYADFGIEKIRLNDAGNIDQVLLHKLQADESMMWFGWYSKGYVIRAIQSDGFTFMTISISNGKWFKGSNIHLVSTAWGKYLRTDGNSSSADNLGNLPEG